jgi:AhpD family alkylhydroperoxidase
MLENEDREKIEKIIRVRKAANRFYTDNSEAYRAFSDVEEATFKDGALSKMEKQLIAAAIGVRDNCESCMEAHIREALHAGATEKQVIEMIDVCIETGGGPATVSARFAMKVLEYYREKQI